MPTDKCGARQIGKQCEKAGERIWCTALQVPQNSTRTITQLVTQPLLNSTGQVRWALNNIVNTVRLFYPALPCPALPLPLLLLLSSVHTRANTKHVVY